MRMDVLTSSDAYLAAEDPIMPALKVIHSKYYKHLGYALAHEITLLYFLRFEEYLKYKVVS